MGTAWGVLLVFGFLIPAVALAATTWWVVRLAGRALAAGATARSPWHFGALHLLVALGVGIGADPFLSMVGLGFLSPLGLLLGIVGLAAVPAYLLRQVGPRGEGGGHAGQVPASRPQGQRASRRWGLASFFVATGVLLPWLTALGVKLYLDSLGRPTYPVSDFLDPTVVPILLIMTLGAWAFPWVVLASALVIPWRLGMPSDATPREGMIPLWGAYAAGAFATIPVFAAVFWEWDVMMLMVPVGVALLPPMALGYVGGWWMVRRGRGRGNP
jgi:hypothetical protein